MSFFRRFLPAPRVWGLNESQVRIDIEDPIGQGLIHATPRFNVDEDVFARPGENAFGPRRHSGAASTEIRRLTIRPVLGQAHREVERVRWSDRDWLEPWEATLAPGVDERLPSLADYQRKTDAEVESGITLPMMIEADGRVIGVVTAANTVRGALYSTTVGYWIVSEYAGRGIASLAVAAFIDLLILKLGIHRVEINIRPENEPSLGIAQKLGLTHEGYRPRYMAIAGQWADHLAFSIDSESLPNGGLVEAIWGVNLLGE
ncbi:MAG: GNAT family N-acetyltransferase [Actinomyces sp.]|uniref:GNAT family N-acetyltransferase n=1 Tax=Actinomyces sp. TaxID=29317 RepID=UPI002803F6B6|nr:GNAT family N-acetyltransferase [Actinomyces sp.]MDU4832537.1 GNAT family N-acetyltransferase [Actinomyces sp.]MDU5232262.1 GNAT family N-acetyltransferase [Actinomyces sp.]MDU6757657.1 GNAT family N-acetyltransferase [Actinomyces sp.]